MPPLRSRNSELGSNVPGFTPDEGRIDEFHLKRLIRADHPWLTTNQFLDKLDTNLQKAMG